MLKSKTFRKWLSMSLTFILVFTLVPGAFAAEKVSPQKIDLKSSAPQLAAEKISPKLAKQFESDEFVTYLVKMAEQADVEAASQKARQISITKGDTPSSTKLAMRNAVVNTLRETASRTQAGLVKYLEKMKKEGSVKEYKSFFIVNAMAITSTKEVMEQIAKKSEVYKILPNEERFLDEVKKTKEVEVKGDNKLNNIEWNIERVNAPGAWALGIDGTGVVVANLDTGVDYTHPALARKWRGLETGAALSWYDAHSGATMPVDTHGHGTHTMGTMVGSEENGTNQIGVAPGAKWIAVRVFNPSTTDAILLDGGEWIIAPRDANGNLHPELAPDVVNNSWGGGPGIDEWYRPMVQAWRAAQIFPEFSAGNDGELGVGSVSTPANYPESFATGATDISNNLAYFSGRGPSPYGELKPEVSAPGVNVRSSVPGGGYEGGWNGTSMAGPHATAVAALLLQANPSLTVDELEQIIMTTATPLTDSEYPQSPNNGYGYGLVNALDAVGSVINGLGTVSGRVVTEGDDLDPPVLQHTPITFAYSNIDIPLTARVSDNVGVVKVEAYARVVGDSYWTQIPMQRTSGDYKDGEYAAAIPGYMVTTDGVEYYILVNDYGNNEITSPTYSIEVSNGITPGYFQDFENDNIGFVSGGTNNTWEWGVPTSGPGAAYSGNKLMATNLEGDYMNGSNSYLLMPPIDLTGSANGGFISFKHWFNLENGYDYGDVYLATADSDYEFVRIMRFNGQSNGWQTQMIDLTPYGGQQVFLLFNLVTDGSVTRPGWYIDDIALNAPDTVAPAAPANLAANQDALGNVTLTWTAPADTDLKEYKIYRSTVSGSNYELIGTSVTTTFTDSTTEDETTYYYVVTAKDFSNNESAYSNEVSITIAGPDTIFSDDFEGSNDNGWTHSGTNDVWERGTPTAAGGPTGAVSGVNVWGTDLDGTYLNNSNFSLYSPVIDLTGVTNATLTFAHWYELETNYDKGYVEISTNGGSSWTQLGVYSHSINGKTWTTPSFDISAYTGNNVQIRFRVNTDGSVTKLGWYIDDFRILETAGPTANTGTENNSFDASKPKPVDQTPLFKLNRTKKEDILAKQPQGDVGINSLPANATVTVLETGRSVRTNPADGRFSFVHVAGEFTLRAEAYGYYPVDKNVAITDGQTTNVNFRLEAIPHGWITGTVTDERTGEPVPGATVMVMEDANVTPVTTDENGAFSLEVLAGTYTVSVTAADYYIEQATVTVPGNSTVTQDFALKPFVGIPGEIGYDDGTAENAWAFYEAGNGWAVRMTPPNGTAAVTGALFRFWDTSWPTPGGTAFKYAIFDASGPDGAPGKMIAGPFDGTAIRDGVSWTEVTLPTPVMVSGDFYVAYIQALPNPNAPGLATDEDGQFSGRSWQMVSGAWTPTPEDEGNRMIRAIIMTEASVPVITSPADGSFTNQSEVTVTGFSNANGATINLYNGDDLAGTATVENGSFSINVTLNPGENVLTAEAAVNGKSTDRSAPITVTLDQNSPTLTVTKPVDQFVTDKEVVHVEGTISDEFLDGVFVNGVRANVRANGTFAHRVIVDEGENLITIRGVDRAGNETIVTRTVFVDLAEPEITNLMPNQDVHINAGESVHVSFDSEPGLNASFRIEVDLGNAPSSNNVITMTETSPGHYEGTWTTPSYLNGTFIIVAVVSDDAGNTVEATAAGKVYVTAGGVGEPEDQAPIAVIRAADATKQKRPTSFDGSLSRDVDGTIVSYQWDFGDGSTASGATVTHRFMSPGTYTVTLTVTDDAGNTNTTTHTIVVN